MEPDEQPRRRARRVADRPQSTNSTNSKGELKTLNLDLTTHAGLETAAKKRGISSRKFAAAAINYFVEAGLDPTQPRLNYIDSLAIKMSEVNADVRQHNAGIGNRLVEIMRAWEKQLYQYLGEIQASHIRHLEQVEANLLQHLLTMQTQALAPLLEEQIRYGLDANIARKMTERIFIKLTGPDSITPPNLLQHWRKTHDEVDEERNKQMVEVLRALLAEHTVPETHASVAPSLTPTPPPAARKPAPPPGPGAVNPAPASGPGR